MADPRDLPELQAFLAGIPFFAVLVIAYAILARRRSGQRARDDMPTTMRSAK